jgi:hypothetical protein
MSRLMKTWNADEPRSSSFEPETGDVAVTVVTALILLAVLCLVAML